MNDQEAEKFLKAALPKYDRVTRIVSSLLENIIREEGIEFLSVTGRTKSLEASLEKFKRKSYTDIKNEMTDLSGVRIITYLDSQVSDISKVISKTFDVDNKNSLDRSQILGDDRVGYRSVHFVCSLGSTRKNVVEYKDLWNIPFEIQIRTVLQHAWAELTHDRSYKFSGTLPSLLQRKLNLYAGMLEVVDNAFDEIARSVDEYVVSLEKETGQKFREEELNSISLAASMRRILEEKGIEQEVIEGPQTDTLLPLLIKMGIKDVGSLGDLFTDDFVDKIKKTNLVDSAVRFVALALAYSDFEKFGLITNGKQLRRISLQFLGIIYLSPI